MRNKGTCFFLAVIFLLGVFSPLAAAEEPGSGPVDIMTIYDEVAALVEQYSKEQPSPLKNAAGETVKRKESAQLYPESYINMGVANVMYIDTGCREEVHVMLTENKAASKEGRAFETALEKMGDKYGERFRILRDGVVSANRANEWTDVVQDAKGRYPNLHITGGPNWGGYGEIGSGVYLAVVNNKTQHFFRTRVIDDPLVYLEEYAGEDLNETAKNTPMTKYPFFSLNQEIRGSIDPVEGAVSYGFEIVALPSGEAVNWAFDTKERTFSLSRRSNQFPRSYRVTVSAYDQDGLTIRQFLSFFHCGDPDRLAVELLAPLAYADVDKATGIRLENATGKPPAGYFERDTLTDEWERLPDPPKGYVNLERYHRYTSLHASLSLNLSTARNEVKRFRWEWIRLSDGKVLASALGSGAGNTDIDIPREQLTEIGVYLLRFTCYDAKGEVIGVYSTAFCIDRRESVLTDADFANLTEEDVNALSHDQDGYISLLSSEFNDHALICAPVAKKK